MRLAGAVLTGGQSRRMGRTKALVDVGGRPMAARVADALLLSGCSEVVLVGGDERELSSLGWPIVADLHPGEGPVGGVLSALRHHEAATHVLIAACDLPDLTAAALLGLLAAAEGDADAVVASTTRLEPAVAIWRVGAMDRVQRAFDDGVRSMHEALAVLDIERVVVDPSTMRNVNRPTDLARDAGHGQ